MLTEELVAKPVGNSCGLHVLLQACITCLKIVEEVQHVVPNNLHVLLFRPL